MNDIARLLTAVHLGAAATAALLLGAIALASSSRARTLGVVVLVLGCATNIVAVLLRAEARAGTALDGLASLGLLAALLALPGTRRWASSLPAAPLLGIGALRLLGLDALAASRGGWLPPSAASSIAAIESLSALAALTAALTVKARPRVALACASLSVAGAVATMAITHRAVRPLPTFAALYAGGALTLCAAAAVVAAAALYARLRAPAV